jgi:transposase-like protein
VCTKYGFSDQTYRVWRYKIRGIQPRKHLSSEKRLRVLREAEKNGVKTVCPTYGISDQTYPSGVIGTKGSKPRKHFSSKKKLKILEEGARDGVYRTCAAYRINPTTYYNWRHKLGFAKLPRPGRPERFSEEEKLAILEEGYKNGILRTCTAYGISSPTYYHLEEKVGLWQKPATFFH